MYTSAQRTSYASNLPQDVVVTQTLPTGEGNVLSVEAAQQAAEQPKTQRPPRPRRNLIPRDCVLNVTDERIREIVGELRRLSLEEHPNAISVLFRVFLELSADAYIADASLATPVLASLSTKLQDVTNDLCTRVKLTRQQANPVRRAAQKDSFLGPSITIMNQWVHNQYMFPGPSDLRAHWNSLQPWAVAIWSS